MKQLSAEDIEDLAVGAWILGTGGGGSPYHALLDLRRVDAGGAVRIEIPDLLRGDQAAARFRHAPGGLERL